MYDRGVLSARAVAPACAWQPSAKTDPRPSAYSRHKWLREIRMSAWRPGRRIWIDPNAAREHLTCPRSPVRGARHERVGCYILRGLDDIAGVP